MRQAIILACLALGIAARTMQYFGQVSLWLDELAVAHTVVVRDIVRLVSEPLAYAQVAPAGFLALQKAAVGILGANELGLRLVPWLASIVALLVFWRLVERLLTPTAAVVTLALFGASPALIWFASQAKQYSTDVLGALLLIWAGCELLAARPRVALAALAGAFAILTSMPAVLTGASIGAILLWTTLRARVPARPAFIVIATCWTIAALMTAGIAQLAVSPAMREYMQVFWTRGFMPAPTSLDALLWTPRVLTEALGFGLFFVLAEEVWLVAAVVLALAVLTVPGAWWLATRRGMQAAVVMAPIVAAIAAAAVKLLPLSGRVSLWLVGPLLLLAGAGLSALGERLSPRVRVRAGQGALLFAVAAFVPVIVIEPPPYRSQDMRPVLEQVGGQTQPGDAIYVYYGARLAMRFYAPGAGITGWTEGNCHRGNTAEYFRELDAFRGRDRVWVVWTHALGRFGEPEAIRSYLSAIGHELVRIDAPGRAGDVASGQALLYDLSDPVRLASITAERHPIPPPERPDDGPNIPCGGPANDSSVVR